MGDGVEFTVKLEYARGIAWRELFVKVVPNDFGSGGEENGLGKLKLQRVKKPRKNHIVVVAPSRVCIRILGGR